MLGLIREDEGAATQVLNGLGVDPNGIRHQVIRLVSAGKMPGWEPARPAPGEAQAVV